MMDHWICPEKLFDGERIRQGMALRIEKGRIVEMIDGGQTGIAVSGCLSPGFVDLQVNGGGGVMFNNAPTPETLAVIAKAHYQYGTVAILPTVITDRPEILKQAADAVLAAQDVPGIMGIHIEGPHISLERRGTHQAAFVRPMTKDTITIVEQLRDAEVPVMITVAPEAVTNSQIEVLAQLGAVVSIGHTDATASAVETVIAAGASAGTHLFNAMSPMQGRTPGAVGAILNAGVHFGLICDGHHVDMRMVQLALRATSQTDRAFLVSDAMATVGGADGFELYGQTIRLVNGRLVNAEGNLAGAHLTMAEGLKQVIQNADVRLLDALKMATAVPAKLMKRPELASVLGRKVSDLIVIAADLSIQTCDTLHAFDGRRAIESM